MSGEVDFRDAATRVRRSGLRDNDTTRDIAARLFEEAANGDLDEQTAMLLVEELAGQVRP